MMTRLALWTSCLLLVACAPKNLRTSTRSVSPEKLDRMMAKMDRKAERATTRSERQVERLERRIDREMMQTD